MNMNKDNQIRDALYHAGALYKRVIYGKWIKRNDGYYTCSNCERDTNAVDKYGFPIGQSDGGSSTPCFCPHCGADMHYMGGVKTFRKKQVIVTAIQYMGKENVAECTEFCDVMKYNVDTKSYYIETLDGNVDLCVGDYIVKDINGEFYPCRADIFNDTYE